MPLIQREFERLADAAKDTLTIDRAVPVAQAARSGAFPAGRGRIFVTGGTTADLAVQLAERPRLRFKVSGTLEQA